LLFHDAKAPQSVLPQEGPSPSPKGNRKQRNLALSSFFSSFSFAHSPKGNRKHKSSMLSLLILVSLSFLVPFLCR
jgi:hypothetical protein